MSHCQHKPQNYTGVYRHVHKTLQYLLLSRLQHGTMPGTSKASIFFLALEHEAFPAMSVFFPPPILHAETPMKCSRSGISNTKRLFMFFLNKGRKTLGTFCLTTSDTTTRSIKLLCLQEARAHNLPSHLKNNFQQYKAASNKVSGWFIGKSQETGERASSAEASMPDNDFFTILCSQPWKIPWASQQNQTR